MTAITLALPIVILGMLFTLVYIACSYGNPRPANWFRLELLAEILGNSLLPLGGIWLLAFLTRRFAANGHVWPLFVPVLLLPVAVQDYKAYMNGLNHVRDCEAVVILCFIPDEAESAARSVG